MFIINCKYFFSNALFSSTSHSELGRERRLGSFSSRSKKIPLLGNSPITTSIEDRYNSSNESLNISKISNNFFQ